MENVLLLTDGSWAGTNMFNPDAPAGENGIEASRVHVHLQVKRNMLDRITSIECEHYGILTAEPGSRLPLFPGRFEITVGAHSLVIENTRSHVQGDTISEDSTAWHVSSSSVDDLSDPVRQYLDHAGYIATDLIPIIKQLVIIFDVESNQMLVEIRFFESHHVKSDVIHTITVLSK